MTPTQETFCPLIKKPCRGLKCLWFTQLVGKHPQTGKNIDEWDCAMKWLPILMIENTKETMSLAASIDSLRNETMKSQVAVLHMTAKGELGIMDDLTNTAVPDKAKLPAK